MSALFPNMHDVSPGNAQYPHSSAAGSGAAPLWPWAGIPYLSKEKATVNSNVEGRNSAVS